MGGPGLRQLYLCPWDERSSVSFSSTGVATQSTGRDLEIFSNGLSNNLFLALAFPASPPPFPWPPGANFWAFGVLRCKVGYHCALSTATLGLAFLDPLIYLPLTPTTLQHPTFHCHCFLSWSHYSLFHSIFTRSRLFIQPAIFKENLDSILNEKGSFQFQISYANTSLSRNCVITHHPLNAWLPSKSTEWKVWGGRAWQWHTSGRWLRSTSAVMSHV